MKIAITGGTGFIGQALVHDYIERGAEVVLISRTAQEKGHHNGQTQVKRYTWEQLEEDPAPIQNVNAFVHLAGETISQRWSKQAKHRIMSSRVETTQQLGKLISQLHTLPEVVVTGSAVGFYGTSLTDTFRELDESLAAEDDFLATVTKKWEEVGRNIPAERSVQLRTGVVLEQHGGALPMMALPYKMFVGGRIGSGQQWVPWIHLQDIVRLIGFCVNNKKITGPVNATAPNPVTNDEFGRTLGNVLQRPHYFPIPAAMFRTVLGEMSTLLLDGQKVFPEKALAHGFEFQYAHLREALEAIYR